MSPATSDSSHARDTPEPSASDVTDSESPEVPNILPRTISASRGPEKGSSNSEQSEKNPVGEREEQLCKENQVVEVNAIERTKGDNKIGDDLGEEVGEKMEVDVVRDEDKKQGEEKAAEGEQVDGRRREEMDAERNDPASHISLEKKEDGKLSPDVRVDEVDGKGGKDAQGNDDVSQVPGNNSISMVPGDSDTAKLPGYDAQTEVPGNNDTAKVPGDVNVTVMSGNVEGKSTTETGTTNVTSTARQESNLDGKGGLGDKTDQPADTVISEGIVQPNDCCQVNGDEMSLHIAKKKKNYPKDFRAVKQRLEAGKYTSVVRYPTFIVK